MVSVQVRQQLPFEPSSLGDRVRVLRTDLAMTHAELAELVGVSRGYITHLESGRTRNVPDPDMMKALAEALATEVWDLLVAAGYLEPGAALAGVDPALVRAAKGKTAQSQKKVTELLRDLP